MNTETTTYRGLEILIHLDESPENPFTACDCEPPTWVYYEGMTGYGDAPDLAELIGLLPENVIAAQWQEIAEQCVDAQEPEEAVREEIENWSYNAEDTPETNPEATRDALQEICHPLPTYGQWGYVTTYFEAMTYVLDLLDWKYHYAISTGYSQGDAAHVLCIATPDWAKLTGAPPETHADQCKGTFILYTAWAWGDCYWFEIPETGDELFGYYGSDHEKSGLLETARQYIDYHLESTEKARQDKLKKLISGKTPLGKREAILEGGKA